MGFIDSLSSAVTSARSLVTRVKDEVSEAVDTVESAAEGVGDFAADKYETAKGYAEAIGDFAEAKPGTPRELTSDEVEHLRANVHGDTIDYSKVRIVEGEERLTKISKGCPFTLGNTIYLPPESVPLKKKLLVHEMTHVWQFQNGGSEYLPKAMYAQNYGDGYDFEKGIAEGKAWAELNPEQQAELLEQAQYFGAFDRDDRQFIYEEYDDAGAVVRSADYTEYLKTALDEVQAGRGAD
jgi:hypothetical protein